MDAFRQASKSNSNRFHEFVSVDASVGSGKTDVASYAIYDYISRHPGSTTASIFIAPRINLCRQQMNAIRDYAGWMIQHNTEIPPDRLRYIAIDSRTPERHDIESLKNMAPGYHYIFVICAASYFSKDKYRPFWEQIFERWQSRGVKMGVRVYDESHNYKSKAELIVARAWYFCTDLLMSGTVARYQREMGAEYEAQCTVKTAMENGWTVKPKLYFVNGDWNIAFKRILLDVVEKELVLSRGEGVAPKMMVSCKNIKQIDEILSMPVFEKGAGDVFNVISIHSEKPGIRPRINGREVSPHEALKVIAALDGGNQTKLAENGVNPALMSIVLQVDMLSEGINVKSFNSVIVTTSVIRKAMQQFGRVFRNYDIEGFSKRLNGHASVYVVQKEVKTFLKFFNELKVNYGVDFDCFKLRSEK